MTFFINKLEWSISYTKNCDFKLLFFLAKKTRRNQNSTGDKLIKCTFKFEGHLLLTTIPKNDFIWFIPAIW